MELAFTNLPTEFAADIATCPIQITPIESNTVARIRDRLGRSGFALAAVPPPVDEDSVSSLALTLGLGDPFLPPLYATGPVRVPAITRISAASGAAHPSFGRSTAQDLHTDGTLQPLGMVRTVILCCRSPATEGGESLLFNAVGAFADLARRDPDAAEALTTDCLVRRATINTAGLESVGPAFAVRDKQVFTRYAVTGTDSWVDGLDAIDASALHRGIRYLARAAQKGTRYTRQFILPANTALILDNARLAHGRSAFRDTGERNRCMFRALYLRTVEE